MITPSDINVLIACEESQAECKAFRALGFNAFSCDIQPPHGGHPEWHSQCDVRRLFYAPATFLTSAGEWVSVPKWHLIIAHPPCTYLCKVSSVHMVKNGILNRERFRLMLLARQFFMECLSAPADFLAVENPLPMARALLPKPDCYIQPSWFGVKYTKKTLYWLRNLPPIVAQLEHPNPRCFVTASRGKYRSRTFPQVANALALQWGDYILNVLNNNYDPNATFTYPHYSRRDD